jgi:hypothetical protein
MKRGLVPFAALCAGVFIVAPVVAEPSCPPGTRPGISGCVDGSARARARSTSHGAREAPAAKSVPKPDPALALERARPSSLERASRRLLMAELLRLESVLKSMPRNAPDRPTVLRRLAEGYAELERLSERERAKAAAAAEAMERLQKEAAPPVRKRRGSGTVL